LIYVCLYYCHKTIKPAAAAITLSNVKYYS